MNSGGMVMGKLDITGQYGEINMPVSGLESGIYFVRFVGDNTTAIEKIIIH